MSPFKPRILIFIDWFLPGYKAGGPVQSCVNMMEHLKGEFDFYVITRNIDYCEVQPYESIISDSWTKTNTYLQVYYASNRRLTYTALAKAALDAKPDIIFINGIYSLYYSIFPLLISRKFNDVKVIVSARGMLAPSAIDVKGGKKKLFLQMAKALGFYRHVCFHATNNTEELHIRNLFGQNQQVKIAPNLPKIYTLSFSGLSKQTGMLRLASVARISPEKNTKYALQVLHEYTFDGNIVFDIFGPVYDEAYWTECVELINSLPGNIQVNYRGSIEHTKVTETLQQYHALFLPTRGENFGHIIFESLTAGRPVVISDQTPWRSLEEHNIGFDIPLNNPAAFAESLQIMLNQTQEEYDMLTNAAYLYAQQVSQDKQAVELNRLLFR
ncbi:glycosyltransferase family 4 protein [Pontibacter sp. KCTC 32443]|uniref:glycosyltransferase family 4 protein n=1 Tax=Pontibacter TaxID=323449 RepID=UPI00164DCA40|nr:MULTISPECIES: glycosyltransferase family 4 protein [Pontibacter]MBC5773485.1 glycosyltransferase family 4 protein [Pontibacter sp. KCTC 32443]